MFKELPPVPNIPEMEKEISNYWESNNIVIKLKEIRKNSPEKVYYDGPITANGIPHYGHAITWTLKDIIPRYWSMQGYLVRRNMGWDCQGIPVEYEVEKELKFEKKEDIEGFGVDKFIDLCRKSVLKYRGIMFDYEKKLGRWFDESEIYSTMEPKYIESMWWSLSELYNKGLLYEGHKVVAYSTRAGCSLSTHEVDDGGYKEFEDPWITVKFELKDEPNTFFLAWTTTPWTIPGNLLLAVGKNIEYVKVACEGSNYILAKERVEAVFEGKSYSLVESINSDNLVGNQYIQPFDIYETKRDNPENCFRVVQANHVSVEDGTGIVHLAPYGAEDFEILMGRGVKLFDYLDETGHFTSEVSAYAGKFYKDANPQIVADLKDKNLLFASGTLIHRMPVCWRTGVPLIYKPVKSWYVAVTKIKPRMLEENQKIGWHPEKIKDANSAVWIGNAKDWALSRSRYWGTPLPVWVNNKTGEKVCIGSFAQLKELSGVEVTDPHKPFVDQITWEDKVNGGTFTRVKDVIDVWYDSGSMPFAQFHYPFENKERFNVSFPAEYIAEGPDQVRLWFYVMHVLGVGLFDKVPYKNVVTIGMLLDETGKKMSKSKRNYKPMDEVLSEYGGDLLRYFILSSTIVSGTDTIFSSDLLKEVRRDFFIPLWNSVKYFSTFANTFGFKPTLDRPNPTNPLDSWILAELDSVVGFVRSNLDSYTIMPAARRLPQFVDSLSTWYIRRSRERIKAGDLTAIHTLYYVLTQFTKLIAPFCPFFSEVLYETLGMRELTGLISVHFDSYPTKLDSSDPLSAEKNTETLSKMSLTRELVSLALSIRVTEGVKVRQPLQTLWYTTKDNMESAIFSELVEDEVNVKEVHTSAPSSESSLVKSVESDKVTVHLDLTITPDLKLEGLARDMIRQIQDLRKEAKLSVNDTVDVTFEQTTQAQEVVAKFGDEIKKKVMARNLTPAEKYEVTKVM